MIDKITSTATHIAQVVNTQAIELPNKVPATEGGGPLSERIAIILQFVFVTMGAIAVLIIAIAGLQYVLSGGDPQKTTRAKDTILYAVIGLVVAIMSFAIVTFVLGRIFG